MIEHALDEYEFHDGTFVGLSLEWEHAVAKILIERHDASIVLEAKELKGISLRRDLPWGESVSIMTTHGPFKLETGGFKLTIKMQSGDQIEIEAHSFSMLVRPNVIAP